MNKLYSAIALAACLLLPAAATAGESDEPFDWLLGCWITPASGSIEVWSRQDEGVLVGFSASPGDNGIGFYELLHLRWDDDTAHYTAHPKGQARTTFSGPYSDTKSVAFVNAEHDYPQKIRYALENDGLTASISLLDGSEERHFNKVRCSR